MLMYLPGLCSGRAFFYSGRLTVPQGSCSLIFRYSFYTHVLKIIYLFARGFHPVVNTSSFCSYWLHEKNF